MSAPAPTVDPRERFLDECGWFDAAWYAELAGLDPEVGRDGALDHYLRHGAPAGLAPSSAVAELQDPPVDGPCHPWDEAVPSEDDPRLRHEMALVESMSLLDRDYYLERHPELARQGIDPLLHFCRVGWRRLSRPRRDFDVWWYWAQHLDPAREALNPLVHHALVGSAAGLSSLPTPTTGTGLHRLPADRPVRRACLFAGYDRHGILDDAVLAYLRELARFADVFYLSDGYMEPAELARLDGLVAGAWAERHGAYDFGSWSRLARDLVGWERLAAYDEVLLVNDSCYLVRPLDELFATMDGRSCDWWGLQATKGLASTRDEPANAFTEPIPMQVVREELLREFETDPVYDFHVGSYFVAFRGPVLADRRFRRLLDSVGPQRDKLAIIEKYEIGSTHLLLGNGHGFDTFVGELHPFHPLFTETAFHLIEDGFPLLKRYLLYQNHYDVPDLVDWTARLGELVPTLDVDVLDRHLWRTSPHDRLTRSFALVRGPGGDVEVPTLLDREAFVAADSATPTDPDRWVFPVSARTHLLPDASRALIEELSQDPAATCVVLSRSVDVRVPGSHVVVHPLQSPEGERELMRAGVLVLDDRPWAAVPHPVLAEDRQVLIVPEDPTTTGATQATRVTRQQGLKSRGWLRPTLIAASEVDRLGVLASHHPATYDTCWSTGLPALDLVLTEGPLPEDLRLEAARLHEQLAGRRLVVLAPAAGRSTTASAYPVDDSELEWLTAWCARHDIVLGLREHGADLERAYRRRLGSLAMDLSVHQYAHRAVVLRAAHAVVTDVSGVGVSFAATGRPAIAFVHDLDRVRDTLLHDIHHVFPGPVCRDATELAAALETIAGDGPDPAWQRQARRAVALLVGAPDDRAASRVVHLVRDAARRDPGAA